MDLSIEGMELGAFDDFLVPLDIDSLAMRIREAVMRKE
jgi:PleD family two-component response regulator